MCLGILLMLLATTVGGCKVEEKNDAKVSDMKFTVISEKELPDELKKQMASADVVLLTDEDWTDDFDNIK